MKVELKGDQRPRIFHSPGPVVGTIGQEVIDLARMAGLKLDDWQRFLMKEGCSVDPARTFWNPYTRRNENRWMAREVTIVVPRQNGKGSWLEARELAGLFILGERTIIHSAHQFATSNEHFQRVLALIQDTPDLRNEVRKNGIHSTHGAEGITLKSGQRLLFKTRSAKGGRGFTGDLVVFDECMFLGPEEIGALMPTLAARPNPQLVYAGSAGDMDIGDCSHLARLRNRAQKGTDKELLYAEWSIDACNDFCPTDCKEHDNPYTLRSYARANPGLGIRVELGYIEMMHESMGKRQFLREILSVGNYPVEGDAWKIISKERWNQRSNAFSQLGGEFALAVDVTPDRSYSCIAVCGAQAENPDLEHVEITGTETDDLDHRPGTQWVVPRIIDIWKNQNPACVIIDRATHAGGFVDELEQAGVKVICPGSRDYAIACGEFRSSVVPQEGETATLVHIGQPVLASAIAEAERRTLMDLWAWDKRTSTADISPLVAATLAKWGYKKHVYRKAAAPWVYFGDLDGTGIDFGD